MTVSRAPLASVVVSWPRRTKPQWGHWQRSPSSPWKSGVVSTPAESVKYSPLIPPNPVASPKPGPLADDGSRDLHPDVHVVLRDSHDLSPPNLERVD